MFIGPPPSNLLTTNRLRGICGLNFGAKKNSFFLKNHIKRAIDAARLLDIHRDVKSEKPIFNLIIFTLRSLFSHKT